MFHRWAALVLVLALCAFRQRMRRGKRSRSPTSPESTVRGISERHFRIPSIRKLAFTSQSVIRLRVLMRVQHNVVTIQILNILAQQVAIPLLEGPSTTATSTVAGGLGPVTNLRLACGDYVTFWDGNVAATGKEAPSGTYIVLLDRRWKTCRQHEDLCTASKHNSL